MNGEPPGAQADGAVRLFFALWPDPAMQAALAEAAAPIVNDACAAGTGARAVPTRNFHLTLAFLGSVAEERVEAAGQVAAACARELGARDPVIDFVFDGVEYWRKPQVLCATARETPAIAVLLAETLKAALIEGGFAPDVTKPFNPHVTLVRKARRPARERGLQALRWTFSDFALVRSRTDPEGSVYTVLESYRLR